MSLSLIKKAVQKTEDGLTGSLVPDVWEVDHVFSKHWHSQERILLILKSRVGSIALRKAQEVEKESTVQSREGFWGRASLGFCVTQSWVKVQCWMNNGSTSTSHFELIFPRAVFGHLCLKAWTCLAVNWCSCWPKGMKGLTVSMNLQPISSWSQPCCSSIYSMAHGKGHDAGYRWASPPPVPD